MFVDLSVGTFVPQQNRCRPVVPNWNKLCGAVMLHRMSSYRKRTHGTTMSMIYTIMVKSWMQYKVVRVD